MKKSKRPLSSDAFTLFGSIDKEGHEQEVREAIDMLINEIIPLLAKKLETITEIPENIFSMYNLNKREKNC